MTAVKIASKVSSHALDALGLHAGTLYANLGRRILVIAELAADERNDITEDVEKESSVTLGIKHLEVANEASEPPVRDALRALYTQRTAYGKLTEDDDVELSQQTLRMCAGRVDALEAARMSVAVTQWASYARSAADSDKLTASDLRRELRTLADGLFAAYQGTGDGE